MGCKHPDRAAASSLGVAVYRCLYPGDRRDYRGTVMFGSSEARHAYVQGLELGNSVDPDAPLFAGYLLPEAVDEVCAEARSRWLRREAKRAESLSGEECERCRGTGTVPAGGWRGARAACPDCRERPPDAGDTDYKPDASDFEPIGGKAAYVTWDGLHALLRDLAVTGPVTDATPHDALARRVSASGAAHRRQVRPILDVEQARLAASGNLLNRLHHELASIERWIRRDHGCHGPGSGTMSNIRSALWRIIALAMFETSHAAEPDREKLAEYAHKAWAGWMEYLFEKCEDGPARHPGSLLIPRESVDRWRRQVSTPYAELSEKEKDSDRIEADKMLAIVKGESR